MPRLIAEADWQTLRLSTSTNPLDPDSPEGHELRSAIDRLTSENLHRIAHRGYENRTELFRALTTPAA